MTNIKTKFEIEKMTPEKRTEYLKTLKYKTLKMMIFEGFPGGYLEGKSYIDLIKVLRFKRKQKEEEDNSWMKYYH